MTHWDERYARGEHLDDEPHPLVVRFASQLPSGRALDVACGTGRHALWLAERGWRVTAVDSSAVALEVLRRRAVQKRVPVDCRLADLERHEFVIEAGGYDLVVVCNYLQRDLFPSIKAGTSENGLVIAVIPMIDDDPNIKPMNPAYLLNPGELQDLFRDWDLVWHFEGKAKGERRRAAAELVGKRR
jgi:SAM-dependent methyltransferase